MSIYGNYLIKENAAKVKNHYKNNDFKAGYDREDSKDKDNRKDKKNIDVKINPDDYPDKIIGGYEEK